MSPLLTFAEAAETLPKIRGKNISTTTLYRWYTQGVKGVRLRCQGVGRRLFVTEADLAAFMRDVADAGPQRRSKSSKAEASKPRTPG